MRIAPGPIFNEELVTDTQLRFDTPGGHNGLDRLLERYAVAFHLGRSP